MQEYAESGGRYAGKMVIYAAFADQVGWFSFKGRRAWF